MSDLLPGCLGICRHEGEAASIWRPIQLAAFPLVSAKFCLSTKPTKPVHRTQSQVLVEAEEVLAV